MSLYGQKPQLFRFIEEKNSINHHISVFCLVFFLQRKKKFICIVLDLLDLHTLIPSFIFKRIFLI